jgi:hypothetical protein
MGATTAAQNVTVTNSGSSAVTISSISTSSDFSQTNNCPATLNASATCTVAVKFAPTATGTRSGSLSVSDSVDPFPITLQLSGNGASGVAIRQLVTDQTALGLSTNFSYAEAADVNNAYQYVFQAGAGTALFYRNPNTGTTSRIAQIGDTATGVTGATFSGFSLGNINNSGLVVFRANWSTSSGFGSGVYTFDGTNMAAVVKSTDSVPGGGATYSSFSAAKVNDSGDILFAANPNGGATTLYIIPHAGSATRIAGAGDPVTGVTGTISNINLISFNNSTQALFTASFGTSGGNGIFLASAMGILKVVATGDAEPGTTSTFAGFSYVAGSSSGYVVFHSSDSVVWLYAPLSGLARVAGPGDAAPSSIGGTLGNTSYLTAVNDTGSLVFVQSVTGSTVVPNGGEVLFRAVPHTGIEAVACNGESIGGSTLLNFLPGSAAINGNGVVAFYAQRSNATGWLLGIQSAGGAPSKIVASGDATPLTGGGSYSTVIFDSTLKVLSDNGVDFRSEVVGGTSWYAEFKSAAGIKSVLSATENALPSGARPTILTQDVSTNGDWAGFQARNAGGEVSYFVVQQSTGTISKLVTDGGSSSAVPGKLFHIDTGITPVSVNANGQAAFTSWVSAVGTGVFLWDRTAGVQKVTLPGDLDNTGAAVYPLAMNGYGTPTANSFGQVIFRAMRCATPSTCGHAILLGTLGHAPTLVAANGGAVPGGGTFSIAETSNGDAINDLGQVAFRDGVAVSSSTNPGVFLWSSDAGLLRIAVPGDTISGTSATFGPLAQAFGLNNAGEVAFMAGKSSGGSAVFVATASTPAHAVVSSGDPAPSGTFNFSTSSNVLINDEHDLMFYEDGHSTLYLRLGGTTTWKAVWSSSMPVPGTEPSWCIGNGGNQTLASEMFSLSATGTVFPGASVFNTSSGCRWGRFVNTGGVLQRVAVEGDVAPQTGNGTYITLPFHVASAAHPAFYAQISGGTVREAIYTVAAGSASAPAAVSVTPNAGSGLSQTFSFLYSDASGYTDLRLLAAMINSSLNAANACYLQYDVVNNSLALMDNSGNNPVGTLTPGTNVNLQNSQCTLSGSGSSVSGSGAQITLNAALAFQSSFSGTRQIYMYASNSLGEVSGWQDLGSWSATGTLPAPPAISTSFGASTLTLHASTSLSFTINNPNSGTALGGVAFTDTLPSGLVVATPNGLTGSCGGGTITATAGASSVALSGATLAALGSCTFSLNLTASSGGTKSNSVTVSSSNAGTGNTATASLTVRAHTLMDDFDGDSKSDFAVYRSGTWWVWNSSSSTSTGTNWGSASDIPVPADYDGDGKTDVAVFRPSEGNWYIIPSSTGIPYAVSWGGSGDVPVPGDYNGDGKADIAVFRPSQGVWYIMKSSTSTSTAVAWGGTGDVVVPGDYDGDGKTDIAIWRPSSGVWFIIPSSTGVSYAVAWGGTDGNGVQDVPLVGDFDGDGKTDIAVWRPSNGVWYIQRSSDNGFQAAAWGATINGAQDVPIPGDFDGDGKSDYAVWRPSNGTWYVMLSGGGSTGFSWGISTDIPLGKRPGQ